MQYIPAYSFGARTRMIVKALAEYQCRQTVPACIKPGSPKQEGLLRWSQTGRDCVHPPHFVDASLVVPRGRSMLWGTAAASTAAITKFEQQDSAMGTLSLTLAQQLVTAAIEKATADFQRPICAAICDMHGFLTAFVRADGAPFRSITISQNKAFTAVYMGMNTDAFLERLRRDNIPASYFCDEKLTALAGGAVLKNARGAVVGGIGISGLTSAEDQVIANFIAEQAAARLAGA
jgi:glc operon protein GlcG